MKMPAPPFSKRRSKPLSLGKRPRRTAIRRKNNYQIDKTPNIHTTQFSKKERKRKKEKP